MKKGLNFTLMVCGASGTGKTTFINTLCEAVVMPNRVPHNPEKAAEEKTVTIKPTAIDIEEEGIKISLTIIDTPGFGENINNESTFSEIISHIERQYDDILAEESRIKRNPKFQGRVCSSSSRMAISTSSHHH